MRACCLLMLCAGLALAQEEKEPSDKEDLARLQGIWYVAAIEYAGAKMPWMDMLGDSKIEVKGNKVQSTTPKRPQTDFKSVSIKGEPPVPKAPLRPVLAKIRTGEATERGTESLALSVKLVPTVTPHHIDCAVEDLKVAPKEANLLGLYRFAGDVLIVCGSRPGKARPNDFKADEHSALVTLVREKEFKARELARQQLSQDEFKKFVGTWIVVEGQFDKTPLTAQDLKDFQLVFKDQQVAWKEAGQATTLNVVLDPAAAVAAMDFIPVEEKPGQPIRCLYKLEGDRLILRLPWNHLLARAFELDLKEGYGNRHRDARLILKKAP